MILLFMELTSLLSLFLLKKNRNYNQREKLEDLLESTKNDSLINNKKTKKENSSGEQ